MFFPKFQIVDSVKDAAHMINRPHEDYPKRVDVTIDILRSVIQYAADKQYKSILVEHDIKSIHSQVMWDLPIDRGVWRTCNVRVGDSLPPVSYKVHEYLKARKLLRIERYGWAGKYPWDWYRQFQEIHPFRDGNGRVGGIVLGFLTYNPYTGSLLAPCQ